MDIVTGVGVLDKSVAVIRAVAKKPLTLNGLQAATGLPRATAHRLAVALEAHGLLRRDDEGRFDLGSDLAVLGRTASDRIPLVGASLPVLGRLRDETGEDVQMFVREGGLRRCAVSIPSPHALRWIVPEGALFALDVGSAGRVLSGEIGVPGWVESVEEREPGVASVSAPLSDSDGHVLAAVSVSGPVDRMTRHPGDEFGRATVGAAMEIARGLTSEQP